MRQSQRHEEPANQPTMMPANPQATSASASSGFAGLVFDSLDSGQETFMVDGREVVVRSSWQKSGDEKTGILELTFSIEEPARFGVKIKIPDDCLNACMTLNDQSLLGWFSDIFPENMLPVPVSPCAGNADHVTPLMPGRLQNLNFRWQNGDRLRMIVVFS